MNKQNKPDDSENVVLTSDSKWELIRSYDDKYIIDMINIIASSNFRKELPKVLDIYVPKNLINNKSNEVKYGERTKQAFVDALKGTPKDVPQKDIKKLQEITEKTYECLYRILIKCMIDENHEFDAFSIEDIVAPAFINTLFNINKDKKCPKEYVEKWYKYSPYVEQNKKIENKINSLPFSLADEKNAQMETEIEDLNNKIQILRQANIEKDRELKQKIIENRMLQKEKCDILDDVNDLQEKNDKKDEKIKELNQELKLEKQTNEELLLSKKSISKETQDLIESYKKQINKYHDDINDLEIKIEKQENIIQEYKDNKNSANDSAKIQEYEDYIDELHKELDENEEKLNNIPVLEKKIIELQNTIMLKDRTIERATEFKAQDLDRKLYSDRKYQRILLNLILSDTRGSKAVIKKLGLADAIIQNYNSKDQSIEKKRVELAELQKAIEELEQQKNQLNKDLSNISKAKVNTCINTLYSYDSKIRVDQNAYKNFEINLAKTYTNNDLNIAKSYFRKIASGCNFLIVDNDKFLEAFSLDNYGIQICRVSVEPSWQSKEDWFGKFVDGKFIPAKTQIADYYSFVKNTEALPFGFIVFDNFDIIPPQIYIQSFIENMVHNGFDNIINPGTDVEEGEEFKRIEKISKLKYIFIKSQDSEMAFDIPNGLKGYELKEVK